MKKLLLILFISLGFMVSANAEICDEDPTVQTRNGEVFLPNKTRSQSVTEVKKTFSFPAQAEFPAFDRGVD